MNPPSGMDAARPKKWVFWGLDTVATTAITAVLYAMMASCFPPAPSKIWTVTLTLGGWTVLSVLIWANITKKAARRLVRRRLFNVVTAAVSPSYCGSWILRPPALSLVPITDSTPFDALDALV